MLPEELLNSSMLVEYVKGFWLYMSCATKAGVPLL